MGNEINTGIVIPEILIPEEKVNLRKWAVIACDQYTSEPEYWDEVEKIVGGAPSTFHIILPEAFLESDDRADRIAHCADVMRNYIDDGVLVKLPRGMIYTERTFERKVRKGVVVSIDLDKYDFMDDSDALIKSTEETVLERIPPRMDIRRKAVIECPHAVILINDPKDSVIGYLSRKKDSFYPLYSFDLMQDGGHINGYFVEKDEDIFAFQNAMSKLISPGKPLFAVGDGNHSLVTAKAIWEETKQHLKEEDLEDHPARYALVEMINLYDPAVEFKPINRVVYNVEPTRFVNEMMDVLKTKGYQTKLMYSRTTPKTQGTGHVINFITKETMGRIEVLNPAYDLEITTLQNTLEDCLAASDRAQIDYVHGEKVFSDMCRQYDSIGFKVNSIRKDELFSLIEKYGVLPKKSFSIGEADEKRFYLECRLISDNIDYSNEEEYEEENYEDEYADDEEYEDEYEDDKYADEADEDYEDDDNNTEYEDDEEYYDDDEYEYDEEYENDIDESPKKKGLFGLFKKKG